MTICSPSLNSNWRVAPHEGGRRSQQGDGKAESLRVKIAYLVTRSEPVGGAQVHVRDLSTALLAKGHHAVVLSGGSGPYIQSLRARGVEAFSLDSLSVPISPSQDL